MKVLLVDQITSINWKYTFSLANALLAKGMDISVVSDLKCKQENCKCKLIRLFNTDEKNISKLKKLFNYINGYKTILKLIKKEKIDVVHLEWITFSPLDFHYIKRIKKICKVILTIHDIIAFDAHFYDKFYYKKVYALPDSLFIQTEENINQFKRLFPNISPSKIHLAYHGHYLEFANVIDKFEARKKLALPKDKFIFMFFGQIKKIKGVDILIKAFGKLKQSNPNVFLVIAGQVWHNDFEQYNQLIKQYNIANDVRTDIKFIPDSEIDLYFSSCDVVCLPYTELYQSGVVQLSYAYKKPAITSNLNAFLTVITDNETGWTFISEDETDMYEKMKIALQSDTLKMGEKGYSYIQEKYSWDKIADKYISAYNEK